MITEDIRQVLVQCYNSTKLCARIVFPDRFYTPFGDIHSEVFRALDDNSIQKVLIMAPRGFGKTSLVNLAYPAKKILFQEKRFIVPISNTATQAVMQSENLKRELMTNSVIRKLWGSMKPTGYDNPFSKEMWLARQTDEVDEIGTLILPRGSGQQVRGVLYRDFRPDLIICDDLEDSESVKSKDQRKKLKEWFFDDVLNSVGRTGKWKVVVIGTLLHEDSLLANLRDDPTWVKVIIDLCDDNYHSNWPEFMSDEDIASKVESYRVQGMLDSFYREYRNQAVAKEDAPFQQQFFKYYEEGTKELTLSTGEKVSLREVENVVLVDPAKTAKMSSADSAIVGAGLNMKANKFFFRDCVAGKLHPDELFEEIYNMCVRLNARVVAIETTGLDEFITYPFKTFMMRKGFVCELIELKAHMEKDERCAMLVPFYRKGFIYHNKQVCNKLEEQLIGFPRTKRKDVRDAWAYLIKVLEEGQRYFFSEMSEEEEKEMDELSKSMPDDFDYEEDIDEEEMMKVGSWRQC